MKHNLSQQNVENYELDNQIDFKEIVGFDSVDVSEVGIYKKVRGNYIYDKQIEAQLDLSTNRGFSFVERPWIEFTVEEMDKFGCRNLAEFSVYVFNNHPQFNYNYVEIYPLDAVTCYVLSDSSLGLDQSKIFLDMCYFRRQISGYSTQLYYEEVVDDKILIGDTSLESKEDVVLEIDFVVDSEVIRANLFYCSDSVDNLEKLNSFMSIYGVSKADIDEMLGLSADQIVDVYRYSLFMMFYLNDSMTCDYVKNYKYMKKIELYCLYMINAGIEDHIVYTNMEEIGLLNALTYIDINSMQNQLLMNEVEFYVNVTTMEEGLLTPMPYSLTMSSQSSVGLGLGFMFPEVDESCDQSTIVKVVTNDKIYERNGTVINMEGIIQSLEVGEFLGVVHEFRDGHYCAEILRHKIGGIILRVNTKFMGLGKIEDWIIGCYQLNEVKSFESVLVPIYSFRFLNSTEFYYWGMFDRKKREALCLELGLVYSPEKYKNCMKRLVSRELFYMGLDTFVMDKSGSYIDSYYVEIGEIYCFRENSQYILKVHDIAANDYILGNSYINLNGCYYYFYDCFDVFTDHDAEYRFVAYHMDRCLFVKSVNRFGYLTNKNRLRSGLFLSSDELDSLLVKLRVYLSILDTDKKLLLDLC